MAAQTYFDLPRQKVFSALLWQYPTSSNSSSVRLNQLVCKQDAACFSLVVVIVRRAIASSLTAASRTCLHTCSKPYFCSKLGHISLPCFLSSCSGQSKRMMSRMRTGALSAAFGSTKLALGLSALLLGFEVFAQLLDAPSLHASIKFNIHMRWPLLRSALE